MCHSLGGILTKEALVNATLNSQFRPIASATTGIVFLGTPHRGSSAADFGKMVVKVAKCLTPGLKFLYPGAVANLTKNNRVLFEMAGRFSNVCSDITIHSFHETVPTRGRIVRFHLPIVATSHANFGFQVVEHQSAILQISNEVKTYGLTADHRTMATFRNGVDPNWFPVSSSICELMASTVGKYLAG